MTKLERRQPGQPGQSCTICGSAAVQVDEVYEAGRLLLSECARCRHRWTHPARVGLGAAAIRVRRVATGEVAIAS